MYPEALAHLNSIRIRLLFMWWILILCDYLLIAMGTSQTTDQAITKVIAYFPKTYGKAQLLSLLFSEIHSHQLEMTNIS